MFSGGFATERMDPLTAPVHHHQQLLQQQQAAAE